MELDGYKAIEDTCGDKYRTEVSDLGLGIGWRDVKAKLLSWGYRVTVGASKAWLRRYRFGTLARDGNASLLSLSRQDLQRWFHVEQLGRTETARRYLAQTGIHYDPSNLERWLKQPAQLLPNLLDSGAILAHPCGQWVLE